MTAVINPFQKFAIHTTFSTNIFSSEVNSGFFYKSAVEREKLVQAERTYTDQRVQKIIDFKKKVCNGNNKGFIVINQKVSYFIQFVKCILFILFTLKLLALNL